MKGNICLLWHSYYPWDIRIEKICRSLVSAGYNVSLICRGKKGQLIVENNLSVRIYRVFPPESCQNNKILTYPLFFNPMWITTVRKILSQINPDLLIVRDIHLAFLAGKLAKQLKIPVIIDMAENYPAALTAYNNNFYKPFLFKNAWLVRAYEKKCLQYMTHIFVVCKEQQDRLVNIGIRPNQISVVKNTPDLNYFQKIDRHNININLADKRNAHKLIYVGYIDVHRGLETLIRGVSLAAKTIPTISLTLVGAGGKTNDEMERLKKLAEEIGALKYIEFTGWLPFEKVPSYIQASDIGIIPHLKSEHTDTTIPNKLFDYMAFSKPVITSDLDPVVNIVKKEKCGLVFKSGDSHDLAEKIIELINSGKRTKLGEIGLNAVHGTYNWNNDQQVMIKTINNLMKS